jgi:hypothetical protein
MPVTALPSRATALGLDTWNSLAAPQRFGRWCPHYSITKNQAAMQDLFKVAHNTTGAAAVRRAKVLKLVEPKEAPVQKPDKNMFDKLSRQSGRGKAGIGIP